MASRIYQSNTVGYFLEEWKSTFEKSSIPQGAESAELIVAHVLGIKENIYDCANQELTPGDQHRINHLCNKRLERAPLQYILREWKFRNLNLKMEPPVFIPWPETERLIDHAVEAVDAKKAEEVLELCCGSGAICLAILKERPHLRMIAVDKSSEACQLTKENAESLNFSDQLQIVKSKITARGKIEGISQKFDVVVSNPPYVPLKDIPALGPEFNDYQDLAACESGDDGMIMIKVVLHICSRMLNPEGKLIMEVNPTHPELIDAWLKDNQELGLKMIRWMEDYNNLPRYVEVVKDK